MLAIKSKEAVNWKHGNSVEPTLEQLWRHRDASVLTTSVRLLDGIAVIYAVVVHCCERVLMSNGWFSQVALRW